MERSIYLWVRKSNVAEVTSVLPSASFAGTKHYCSGGSCGGIINLELQIVTYVPLFKTVQLTLRGNWNHGLHRFYFPKTWRNLYYIPDDFNWNNYGNSWVGPFTYSINNGFYQGKSNFIYWIKCSRNVYSALFKDAKGCGFKSTTIDNYWALHL